MLELFEHDDTSAFAHEEAVARLIPGTRCLGRIVVEIGRESARSGEAGDAEPADRRFGAAADHHIGIVPEDEPRRIADRMRAGRARGHHRVVGSAEAVADRDVAGGEIDEIGGNEERRKPSRSPLVERDRALGDARKSADAGADHDAGALARLLTVREPTGVLYRLSRSSQRKDDESIHLTLILGRYPIIGVKQS